MKSSADVQPLDECNVRLVDPERVAAVNARMPSEADVVDTADVFGLLGDPRRLKLLVALAWAARMPNRLGYALKMSNHLE